LGGIIGGFGIPELEVVSSQQQQYQQQRSPSDHQQSSTTASTTTNPPPSSDSLVQQPQYAPIIPTNGHRTNGEQRMGIQYNTNIEPAFLSPEEYPPGWSIYDPIRGVIPKD